MVIWIPYFLLTVLLILVFWHRLSSARRVAFVLSYVVASVICLSCFSVKIDYAVGNGTFSMRKCSWWGIINDNYSCKMSEMKVQRKTIGGRRPATVVCADAPQRHLLISRSGSATEAIMACFEDGKKATTYTEWPYAWLIFFAATISYLLLSYAINIPPFKVNIKEYHDSKRNSF